MRELKNATEHPAPVLKLTKPGAPVVAATESVDNSSLPIVLGIAGMVCGLAGLVLGGLAFVRTRRPAAS